MHEFIAGHFKHLLGHRVGLKTRPHFESPVDAVPLGKELSSIVLNETGQREFIDPDQTMTIEDWRIINNFETNFRI